MNNTIKFLVSKKNNGQRLDVYLAYKLADLTRSHIKKIIQKQNVEINGKLISHPSTKIKTNDKIKIIIEFQ